MSIWDSPPGGISAPKYPEKIMDYLIRLGPIGLWKFDDDPAGGSILDYSGNGKTLTVEGAGMMSQETKVLVNEPDSKCIRINKTSGAANHRFKRLADADLQATGDFTIIGCLCNGKATTHKGSPWCAYDNSTDGLGPFMTVDYRAGGGLGGTNLETFSLTYWTALSEEVMFSHDITAAQGNTDPRRAGMPHIFAIRRQNTGSRWSLWIDGVEVGHADDVPAMPISGVWNIGGDDWSNPFSGYYAGWAYFDKCITDEQLSEIYSLYNEQKYFLPRFTSISGNAAGEFAPVALVITGAGFTRGTMYPSKVTISGKGIMDTVSWYNDNTLVATSSGGFSAGTVDILVSFSAAFPGDDFADEPSPPPDHANFVNTGFHLVVT